MADYYSTNAYPRTSYNNNSGNNGSGNSYNNGDGGGGYYATNNTNNVNNGFYSTDNTSNTTSSNNQSNINSNSNNSNNNNNNNNNNNSYNNNNPSMTSTTASTPSLWNPVVATTIATAAAGMIQGQGTNSNANDTMFTIGQQVTTQFIDESTARLIPGLETFMTTLRVYFAVNNGYVKRKMARVLFSFFCKNWSRIVSLFLVVFHLVLCWGSTFE